MDKPVIYLGDSLTRAHQGTADPDTAAQLARLSELRERMEQGRAELPSSWGVPLVAVMVAQAEAEGRP